jgi:hypothetical protein
MENQNFTTSFSVENTPEEVFNAINNVRDWWSENIEGGTDKLNDVFSYRYKDSHRCKIKLIEVIPNQKVVWLVLENYFDFLKDQSEWKDTKITFEISRDGNKTRLIFTHVGLVPDYECYDACSNAWTFFIGTSLKNLITKGKGEPLTKEG